MKTVRWLCLLLGAFAAVPPALADDSSAQLGAGGLVLTKSADIRMASEDLYLSPKSVRVHYTFVNDSKQDIDIIVAFPLPDVNNEEYAETPMGTVTGSTPNFVGFKLTVDGKPVAATAEEHAIFKGKDVTAQVRAAGLPGSLLNATFYDKLNKLPAPARQKLLKAGLIEDIGSGTFHAKWTATTKFWWKQHFPAGKAVTIDHSYQPVTGQSFFSETELTPSADYHPTTDYCVDADTRVEIVKTIKSLKNAVTGTLLNASRTEFVILTANNWKGPIGRFHLTLDKLKPNDIISLCWKGDLKKTGPTTFESTLVNFAPKQDIKLLVLEKPSPQ